MTESSQPSLREEKPTEECVCVCVRAPQVLEGTYWLSCSSFDIRRCDGGDTLTLLAHCSSSSSSSSSSSNQRNRWRGGWRKGCWDKSCLSNWYLTGVSVACVCVYWSVVSAASGKGSLLIYDCNGSYVCVCVCWYFMMQLYIASDGLINH